MDELMLDQIQPGWKVVDGEGKDLGTVVGTTKEAIRVKTGGLVSSGELIVPIELVAEVETGRVDLKASRSELEQKQA